jgi:competence protein ComEA
VDVTRPAPAAPPPAAAWPHAAQLAAAFLLGAAAALLSVRLSEGPPGRPLDVGRPPIDLNRADRGELLQLPGVGPALADRIADTREVRGGFRAADDLRTVSGIGPARASKVGPWVRADAETIDPRPAGGVSISKKVDAAPREPVDLNDVPVERLQGLPGIGPKLAGRIVAERAKRPFATVDDLRRVSGIGPKTLEKIRPYVTIKKYEPQMNADERR